MFLSEDLALVETVGAGPGTYMELVDRGRERERKREREKVYFIK